MVAVDNEDLPVLELYLFAGEGDDPFNEVKVWLLGSMEDDYISPLEPPSQKFEADDFGEKIVCVMVAGKH